MMTVVEVERMTEALKSLGLNDSDILFVQKHIATGMALPKPEPAEKKGPTNPAEESLWRHRLFSF